MTFTSLVSGSDRTCLYSGQSTARCGQETNVGRGFPGGSRRHQRRAGPVCDKLKSCIALCSPLSDPLSALAWDRRHEPQERDIANPWSAAPATRHPAADPPRMPQKTAPGRDLRNVEVHLERVLLSRAAWS